MNKPKTPAHEACIEAIGDICDSVAQFRRSYVELTGRDFPEVTHMRNIAQALSFHSVKIVIGGVWTADSELRDEADRFAEAIVDAFTGEIDGPTEKKAG